MTESPFATIRSASIAMRRGETSSTELVGAAFDRADKLDAKVGVFTARFDEAALAEAAVLDHELRRGLDRGPLHGMPVGIKDIIASREGPTSAQTAVPVPEWAAIGDAEVVARLRASGAVIVGKLTTMEFAGGVVDSDNPYPLPRNPWDLERWPGGSSSGSGSGVATGMMLGAVGTDTGGSIRSPAAMCGVTGFKPTFRSVPNAGVMPTGWSYDTTGPLARSAWDCAAMFESMANVRVMDELTPDLAGLRIGVDRTLLSGFPDADRALVGAYEVAVATLSALGARVIEVSVPYMEELAVVTMMQSSAQAYAWHRLALRDHWELYGRSLKRNLVAGLLMSAGDMVQLDLVRRIASRAIAETFAAVDAVVLPTAPSGAPLLSDVGHLDELTQAVAFTAAWSAVGYPAISVPIGFTTSELPVGMQIVGPAQRDGLVLRMGHAYQQRTQWHLKTPQILEWTQDSDAPRTSGDSVIPARAGESRWPVGAKEKPPLTTGSAPAR